MFRERVALTSTCTSMAWVDRTSHHRCPLQSVTPVMMAISRRVTIFAASSGTTPILPAMLPGTSAWSRQSRNTVHPVPSLEKHQMRISTFPGESNDGTKTFFVTCGSGCATESADTATVHGAARQATNPAIVFMSSSRTVPNRLPTHSRLAGFHRLQKYLTLGDDSTSSPLYAS